MSFPLKSKNIAKLTFICQSTSYTKSNIKSRSEQAPGSEFHPRDKSEKNYCAFWDLLGAIKR